MRVTDIRGMMDDNVTSVPSISRVTQKYDVQPRSFFLVASQSCENFARKKMKRSSACYLLTRSLADDARRSSPDFRSSFFHFRSPRPLSKLEHSWTNNDNVYPSSSRCKFVKRARKNVRPRSRFTTFYWENMVIPR